MTLQERLSAELLALGFPMFSIVKYRKAFKRDHFGIVYGCGYVINRTPVIRVCEPRNRYGNRFVETCDLSIVALNAKLKIALPEYVQAYWMKECVRDIPEEPVPRLPGALDDGPLIDRLVVAKRKFRAEVSP